MRKKILFYSVIFLFPYFLHAQELNCSVQVLSQQIQSSDKRIFETLQTAIYEFMNNRKWTTNQFLNQERIECTFVINITERSSDEFSATIQVQAKRPVFKSSYNTTLLNFNDKDFQFRYLEYQPLEFSEQSHTSNLTSVLAFYAYIILGLDYDSFALEGGTPYFQKAQTIVNNAQNDNAVKGWKANEVNLRNRYWFSENVMNPQFKSVREAIYKYHRNGLDNMTQNVEESRNNIYESLGLLKKLFQEKPGAFFLRVFFEAKADEIVNVYSQAYPDEKTKVINLLNEIDPANGSKYQKIMKPN